MKKILIAIALIPLVSDAQININSGVQLDNLNRNDYTIMEEVVSHSRSNKIWILFIPIGGKSQEKRERKAYNKALKECKCDGLISPRYTERKVLIPLILVNFVHRSTTVKGKGFKIKTG